MQMEVKMSKNTNASKLKEIREAKGLSQWELALKSKVSYRMVQYYEQGVKDINKAQIITVARLADALECDMNDLIDDPKGKKE